MEWLIGANWHDMFVPQTPLLEIFLRGSLMYLSLFCLLRLVLRRQAGSVGMTDLLVIVLIADASQNAMANDYKSIPDGILLVVTLIFWNFTLEWIGFHSPRFEAFIHPPPLPLVRNGRKLHRNMKRELISDSDLMSMLREQGIEHLSDVKRACLEGTGKISVVKVKD